MFNSELKEKAKKVLEEVYGDYKRTLSNTINHSESLYEKNYMLLKYLKILVVIFKNCQINR